jgi:CheY-like chemotaxis protein
MATDLPGILIVDDNEDNRYTLQLMLESVVTSGSLARPVETRRSLCITSLPVSCWL